MKTPSWICDEHGTQNLRPNINGSVGHVWIQGRRPYCDRGHWEWGVEGIPAHPDLLPKPSYYFMRKERLMEEAEAWLMRACGGATNGRSISDLPTTKPMDEGASAPLGARWEKLSEHKLATNISREGTPAFSATIEEKKTPAGPVFVFDVDGLEVDASDRFPRAYLDIDRAVAEAEEFFAWRLLKIPAEHPHFLQESERDISDALLASLQTQRPTPKRLRP